MEPAGFVQVGACCAQDAQGEGSTLPTSDPSKNNCIRICCKRDARLIFPIRAA
jgi:hypothetical protein